MTSTLLWVFLTFLCCACMNPAASFENGRTSLADEIAVQSLRIYALDVGQGDATLVVDTQGQAALIDGGPPFSGITRILPQLRSLNISKLQWVLISHYDNDHLGGLLEVLRGEDQEWDTADDIELSGFVWDRGGTRFNSNSWFDEYKDELEERDLRRTVDVGQTFSLGDDALATVVLSNGDYLDATRHHLNPDEENEASVALLIEYGNFRYLSAGDLTGGGLSGQKETKDLESHLGSLIGDIDILHLNHHGSRTSSNENYLDTLTPEAALIGLGKDNDFGHPHSEILDRLEERLIDVYRSDEGRIEVKTDGEGYEILL